MEPEKKQIMGQDQLSDRSRKEMTYLDKDRKETMCLMGQMLYLGLKMEEHSYNS